MKTKIKAKTLPYSRAGLTALLGLGAASTADALIVMSSTVGAGISPPSTAGISNFWDVDNDGTNDFELRNSYGASTYYSAIFKDNNGGRVFGKTSDLNAPFLKIAMSQAISSGVTGYGFASVGQVVRVTADSFIAAAADGGWAKEETGLIGFKFTNGSGTHFGWADVTIGTGNEGYNYTINEAWYNTTPGQGLLAGTQTAIVPEPTTTAAGLAALALGAAGLSRWRKGKAA